MSSYNPQCPELIETISRRIVPFPAFIRPKGERERGSLGRLRHWFQSLSRLLHLTRLSAYSGSVRHEAVGIVRVVVVQATRRIHVTNIVRVGRVGATKEPSTG